MSRHCSGVNRRDFVRVGALSAFGVGVGHAPIGLQAAGSSSPAAKRCVLIWLDGGPSHLETFDPKPAAPKEVRGPFAAISTPVPGTHISEVLPQTAKIADRFAIVRSVTSPLGEHNLGTQYLLTGYKPTPVLEYPTYGAVLGHVRKYRGVLPGHVAVPTLRVGGSKLTGHGFLPAEQRPFAVGGDPGRPNFRVRDLDAYLDVDAARLDRRRAFLKTLDDFQARGDARGSVEDPAYEQAFRLVASREAKQAFDLTAEPAAVRQRYGSKTIGQSCLLARRLLEAGVPFVTVNNPGWDTHKQLSTRMKDGYAGARVPVGLAPSLDLAFASLMQDLEERGMLDDTLVVVMGEFGRTPKLNTAAGRDHWPRVFSVLLAGAGVPGGLVLGASDRVGEGPIERPITPGDLAATIYQLLGIAPSTLLHTPDGRPVHVSRDGQVISELIG
ncbi:MAG TPA: DUF1501 domain-containing protein [Planctomycetaceae bacterium]|nr:hypothetical protein [Blastopirellula sp.]HAY82683.1 DUF1501 domain-containing protein [Planctomycetaceae bacterium]